MGWFRSGHSEEYLKTLIHRGRRRHFGLLERPSLSPNKEVTTVDYKIFICGRTGIGKTATIAKLAGATIPDSFCETPGIETTAIYWPALIRDTRKVIYFRLNFWDVGDNAIKKFDHILPACLSNVDCMLYTFSFTDRSSFEDIPQLLSRMTMDSIGCAPPAQAFVGTRADQYTMSDISEAEIRDLVQSWKIPVLRTKNVAGTKPIIDQLKEIAPIMNTICNMLWARDNSHVR